MEFDWHPAKEALVRSARGFGFADAAGIFLGRVAEWRDTRKDDGEVRMVAVGVSDGTFYTVVYSDRTNERGGHAGPLDHHRVAVASKGARPMAKISLNELRTRIPSIDRAKLDATTDAQIEAYRIEDGYGDLPTPDVARVVESPQALRVRLGLTQKEIAAALRIPLGTWRNWEQGRVSLEPAAVALLVIFSRMPEAAMDALGGSADRVTGTL